MTNDSRNATSEQSLLEESASLLASYAMAVRHGKMSIDEAIASAFRSGVHAGRWATRTEQARNRRSARRITFQGRTQLLSDWAREVGVNVSTLSMRLNKYKWSLERALTRINRAR